MDTPARILVENGHEQTFAYRFDWDELREVNGVDLSRLVGAAHALEILFVMGTFDNFIIKSFLFGRGSFRPALELSSNIQSYWAEFAYTGNPGKGTNNALPLWKKWSNEGEKYLILDSTLDQGIKMSDEEYNKLVDQVDGFLRAWVNEYQKGKPKKEPVQRKPYKPEVDDVMQYCSLDEIVDFLKDDPELTDQERFELYYDEREKRRERKTGMSYEQLLKKSGVLPPDKN